MLIIINRSLTIITAVMSINYPILLYSHIHFIYQESASMMHTCSDFCCTDEDKHVGRDSFLSCYHLSLLQRQNRVQSQDIQHTNLNRPTMSNAAQSSKQASPTNALPQSYCGYSSFKTITAKQIKPFTFWLLILIL